jgi:hypothetical protein
MWMQIEVDGAKAPVEFKQLFCLQVILGAVFGVAYVLFVHVILNTLSSVSFGPPYTQNPVLTKS